MNYSSSRKYLGRIFRRKRFKQARNLVDLWLSPNKSMVQAIQLEKLKCIWNDAVENVPYYSELVRNGEAPKEIRSIDQFFSEVPVTTKQQLLKNNNLLMRRKKPHQFTKTSGSTWEPFEFGQWKDEGEINAINQTVGRIANGMDIDDSILFVWGHSHLLGTGFKKKLRYIERGLKDFCMNYKRISAYKLDQNTVEKYHNVLNDFKPKAVLGYSSALDLFTRQSKNKLDVLNIKFVIATSEVLPFSDSEEIITSFFRAPLIMEYGGVDFGLVSYNSISNKKQKVFWWSHLVEATKSGEIIVTSLYNKYLPFIRFKTGDILNEPNFFDNCSVKSFASILGRKSDYLRMPDGKLIHCEGIPHSVRHIKSIKGIQLVMNKDNFTIQLLTSHLSEQDKTSIRARLNSIHPLLGRANINLVNDLDTNIAGKRSLIIKKS